MTRLRKLFSTLRWWELMPDTANELVTAGRGTELTTDEPKDVLENDYDRGQDSGRPPGRRVPAHGTHDLGEPLGHGRRHPSRLDRPNIGQAPPRAHVARLHDARQERRRRPRLAPPPDQVSASGPDSIQSTGPRTAPDSRSARQARSSQPGLAADAGPVVTAVVRCDPVVRGRMWPRGHEPGAAHAGQDPPRLPEQAKTQLIRPRPGCIGSALDKLSGCTGRRLAWRSRIRSES